MSLGTILVVILIIFLLGGFSGRFGYGYGHFRLNPPMQKEQELYRRPLGQL